MRYLLLIMAIITLNSCQEKVHHVFTIEKHCQDVRDTITHHAVDIREWKIHENHGCYSLVFFNGFESSVHDIDCRCDGLNVIDYQIISIK